MKIRNLTYLIVALLATGLLWGCGSSGGGGSDFVGQRDIAPDYLGNANCVECHTNVHTTEMSRTRGEINHLAGIIADGNNSYYIAHACEDCHGGGSAHRGIGPIPYPRPDVVRCAACHDEANAVLASNHNRGDATNISMIAPDRSDATCGACHTTERMIQNEIEPAGALPATLHNVSCAACHDTLTLELRTLANSCANCHTTLPADHLNSNPFSNEISQRYVDSPKGALDQTIYGSGSGCRACHSHQGAVVLLSLSKKVNTRGELTTAYAGSYGELQTQLYPDPSGWNDSNANMKRCSTCHDPHSGEVRGVGDLRVSDLDLAVPSVSTSTGPANRVVYSAEFNLCTSCHMASNLVVTWNPSLGYDSGGMFEYQLGNLTVQDNQDRHYSATAGENRTILDTHFSDGNSILGYGINPGSPNACTSCHDPHSNSKINEFEYAEGFGMTHGNYASNAFSRDRTGCTPCHTGRDFVKTTLGAALGSPQWNPLGCVSCHDLTSTTLDPSTNYAVRAMPNDFVYTFTRTSNNQTITAATEPSLSAGNENNRLCFECHKGRTSNTHYKASFTDVFGRNSGFFEHFIYEPNTYNNRAQHSSFGCISCHDIHAAYDETIYPDFTPRTLKTNISSCTDCHDDADADRNFTLLRDRTKVFEDVLLELIHSELSYTGTVEELEAAIGEGTGFITDAGIKKAADIFRYFRHQYKGFWAHNSVFARQLMHDAIKTLDPAALANLVTKANGNNIGTLTGNGELMRDLNRDALP